MMVFLQYIRQTKIRHIISAVWINMRLFFVLKIHQHIHLLFGEVILWVLFIDHTIRHTLFVNLSVVNFLLHAVVSDHTIHKAALLLAITINPAHSLTIMAGIP